MTTPCSKSIPSITIAGRRICTAEPPYVIAEISANHNGSLDTALSLVSAAANAGAAAVKLQSYLPDTITLDCDSEDFRIRGGLWDGRTLYDLYNQAHTPWEWHKPLFDHARDRGVTMFSSPFDRTAVDMLEALGAPAYKIASFEAVDLPLIRYAARTGKPLVISTGMANAREMEEALGAAREAGCTELALLHCVSGYPAPAADYNLRTIPDMASRFGVVLGLSDHTLGNVTAIASIGQGAAMIEKHFTLDRSGGGPDDSFSIEPKELGDLVRDCRLAWEALGGVCYDTKSSEVANVKFRRSLYFVKAMKAGDIITMDCVRSVRPGFGIAPKFIDAIVGKTLQVDVAACTPLKWESLRPES